MVLLNPSKIRAIGDVSIFLLDFTLSLDIHREFFVIIQAFQINRKFLTLIAPYGALKYYLSLSLVFAIVVNLDFRINWYFLAFE